MSTASTGPLYGRPEGREGGGAWTTARHALLSGDERVKSLERPGALAARILMSQIFLISGVMKILNPSGTADEMAAHGMFWIPFFLVAATVVELAGGLSLLVGYQARLGALALFLYLIPVTLTFHTFWTYPPDQQRVQMLFFVHNLALMGGLLYVAAFGPGPWSCDRQGRAS